MADNPFGGDSENPFADPSVADMTNKAAQGVGDFNPFAEQDQSSKPALTTTPVAPPPIPTPTAQSQPAVLETRQEPPPPYVVQDEQENLRKRQEELEKKAAELQRKEQELQRMQYTGYRENNFPPLPKWFRCKPCFFHDIQVDIPVEYQKTCRFLFLRWQVYIFVLFFNFITALAFLCTGAGNDIHEGTTFGVSIVYLFLNVPLSFLGWYRPGYKGLKNDSSFSYVVFFLIYFLHIAFNIFYCLGIPGSGACGFINATQAIHNNKAIGIMMFVCGAMFLAGVIVDILLLIRLHRIYRQAGASFEKAQGEFAKGMVTNPHVQTAAAAGVRAAMDTNQK